MVSAFIVRQTDVTTNATTHPLVIQNRAAVDRMAPGLTPTPGSWFTRPGKINRKSPGTQPALHDARPPGAEVAGSRLLVDPQQRRHRRRGTACPHQEPAVARPVHPGHTAITISAGEPRRRIARPRRARRDPHRVKVKPTPVALKAHLDHIAAAKPERAASRGFERREIHRQTTAELRRRLAQHRLQHPRFVAAAVMRRVIGHVREHKLLQPALGDIRPDRRPRERPREHHRRRQAERRPDRPAPPGPGRAARPRAGQDGFTQSRGRRDLAELRRHRGIVRPLAGEPCRERRIRLRLLQGFRKHRIARVASTRPIRAEDEFRLLIVHACCLPTGRVNGTTFAFVVSSRASAARNCAFPRESRDITVPIGTSSASAISRYDMSSR